MANRQQCTSRPTSVKLIVQGAHVNCHNTSGQNYTMSDFFNIAKFGIKLGNLGYLILTKIIKSVGPVLMVKFIIG